MLKEDHDRMVGRAEKAIKNAQDVRFHHRKRTRVGHRQRNIDIQHALRTIQFAMQPIRSSLGRAAYDDPTETNFARYDSLRNASKRLQAERRKLWKLRGGKDYKKRKRPILK